MAEPGFAVRFRGPVWRQPRTKGQPIEGKFLMGSEYPPRLFTLRGSLASLSVLALLALAGPATAQTPDFDFGDGRHGSFTLPPGETTIQDLWSQVRRGADAPGYDPADDAQVPSLENLTISSGGTLTVSGYSGSPASPVDPAAGGVLRLKVRGTLTIQAGAAISATGKGYRGGTMEGSAPGYIGQQGDSWGNGGATSGDANRGGGGGGFGAPTAGNDPGSGGGGGHREAGARGATGQGTQTGGLGGQSFDTVATTLGQGFRESFPFPRFGSGGGRAGQVENFANTIAFGGNGGGVIIIEAQHIINEGSISADGAPGGSNFSGGGGGAGGSILIQTLSVENGTVTANGGAGGVGTVLGNDGGSGGIGILLWDTRFEVKTAVSGQGTIELSPPGGFYDENAQVEVLAVPEEGWRFDRWERDLSGTENPATLIMDADKSVTAVFVPLPALNVSPRSRDVGPSGGNISFNVTVSGNTGAIDWTAVVETGSEFITINQGAAGTNDGVITVIVARSPVEASRTGTIVVASEDVGGDPVTVTITQGPATPVLSVTPADATASAEGEELVFQVRNTGTGAFDWTATLLAGQAFASISSADTGTNDGTFVVSLTENLSALQRTATLSVSAPGALNSPMSITITQQAGVPLLQVSPSSQLIGSASGIAALGISNGGNGVMNWTASVIEGAAFANITEGSSGTNAGSVSIFFQNNTSLANRTATIRVESVDAANSPVDVTITQTAQEAVLLVTPETQTAGSGAGTASYQVQNTGTGAMGWTASVVTGANFVSIASGGAGVNDGVISINVAQNTGIEERTATLQIVAPGAANSPQTVTLVQASRRPVLRVVPAGQSIGSAGGAVHLTIENGGTGTLAWTASLGEGAEYLTITSASSGVDDGAIQVTVAANASGESRTGTVHIEAPGAVDSPQTATILQLGCGVLARPENVAASDGVFSNTVEIIWSAVPNTIEYEIFRSPLDAPERRELIGTSTTPRYSDTLADPPDYELVNRGCFNPGEFIITYVHYFYEVRAVNACGASDFSVPTTGYRGLPSRNGAEGEGDGEGDGNGGGGGELVVKALPAPKSAGTAVIAGPGDAVAVRLRTSAAIDPASIWSQVDGVAVDASALQWIPVDDGDGWVVVSHDALPAVGGPCIVDAGATAGAEGAIAASFDVYVETGDDKAAADGLAVVPHALADESEGLFLAGLGNVYAITPQAPFVDPVLIQIPVPDGVSPASVALYYDGGDAGWYPAENVAGWLSGPVALSEDGAFIEAWVNHGGIVRAGRAPGVAVPVAGSVWPADYGTLAVLAITALLLALAGRRKRAGLTRG